MVFNVRKKKVLFLFLLFGMAIFILYQLEYKRYIISNRSGTEHLTIWTSSSNKCFIIPGRYYSPIPPKQNFIKTVNHRNYIGIVWNTKDQETDYKVSIYNDFELHALSSRIKVYRDNNSLLSEYNISTIGEPGKRQKTDSSDYYKREIEYEYIDLNRIWGIKRFKW